MTTHNPFPPSGILPSYFYYGFLIDTMETPKTRKRTRSSSRSSHSSVAALPAGEIEMDFHTWPEYYRKNILQSKKDDFSVFYYMTGDTIVQADRNYVAQVMMFYARRKKSDSCPNAGAVVLRGDVLGLTTNRAADDPVEVVFKTPKHINAMFRYFHDTRLNYNSIVVHISVDNSPFFAVTYSSIRCVRKE
jgi:hypothetical protein